MDLCRTSLLLKPSVGYELSRSKEVTSGQVTGCYRLHGGNKCSPHLGDSFNSSESI